MSPEEEASYRARLAAFDWNTPWIISHKGHERAKELRELAEMQRRADPDFVIWNSVVPPAYLRRPRLY